MMKVGEYKAIARESLLGRYRKIILADIVMILVLAAFATGAYGGFYGAKRLITADPGTYTDIVRTAGTVGFSVLAAACAVLGIIFIYIFSLGMLKLMLNISRSDKYGVKDLFFCFSEYAHPIRPLCVSLLIMLRVALFVLIPTAIAAAVCIFIREDINGISAELIRIIAVVACSVIGGIVTLYKTLSYSFAVIISVDRPSLSAHEALRRSAELTKHIKLKLFWLFTFSFILWDILDRMTLHILGLWLMPYRVVSLLMMYMDADGTLWQAPGVRPAADITANIATGFTANAASNGSAAAFSSGAAVNGTAAAFSSNTEANASDSGMPQDAGKFNGMGMNAAAVGMADGDFTAAGAEKYEDAVETQPADAPVTGPQTADAPVTGTQTADASVTAPQSADARASVPQTADTQISGSDEQPYSSGVDWTIDSGKLR